MLVAALLVIWVLVGAAIALRMVRRGHNPVLWFALVFYGPLLALLASSARDREQPRSEVLTRGATGEGPVDVVAGVDGSAASLAAVRHVLDLLGPRLGDVTLAAVVDYDVATYADAPSAPEHDARQALASAAAVVVECRGPEPTTVLLTGAPSEALAALAIETGASLLVVGARGRGGAARLLGSVAERLAGGAAPVPVLVVNASPSRS